MGDIQSRIKNRINSKNEKYMESDDRSSGEAAKKTNEAVGEGSSSMREEERVEVKNGDWSLLPALILNTVFTYLPRTDQASASQVCRNWSRAMDNPNLWRKIEIHLGETTLETLQSIVRFTKRYCHHLRYLTIQYHPTSFRENPEFEIPVTTLIDDIHGRAQLRSFILQSFVLNGDKPKAHLSEKFLNSVYRFLKGQHTLSEVDMDWYNATINQGNDMLQAIAEGSGSTLQTLKLENFFNTRYAVFEDATYLSILDKFKHLEVLSCDYCCVSEEVILCLAHNCAGRLRSLVIICQVFHVHFQTIGNDTWKQFKIKCPNGLVDFQLWNIRGLETLTQLVPCQVPLRSLTYIMTYFPRVIDLDPINFIIHVLTHFESTLEDLHLQVDDTGTVPNVGTVLEEFLPSLKNLKRLVVTADISDTFVENVNAMREKKLIHLSEFCHEMNPLTWTLGDDSFFPITTGRASNLILTWGSIEVTNTFNC